MDEIVTDSEMVAAIRDHREMLEMVGHKPRPRDNREAVARLQYNNMIAAGWHKHEPVAIDDLLFAKLREAIQEAWNEPHEGSFGLFLDKAVDGVLAELHKAGWRKVPPEGEGPSLNLRGIKYQGALIGMAEYRNYLLAQEEK